jgi:hypothetical protein
VRQLEDEQAKLTPLSTAVFWQLYDECLALEQRVAYYHEKLTAMARAHPVCQRIYTGSYPVSRSMAQAIRLPVLKVNPNAMQAL